MTTGAGASTPQLHNRYQPLLSQPNTHSSPSPGNIVGKVTRSFHLNGLFGGKKDNNEKSEEPSSKVYWVTCKISTILLRKHKWYSKLRPSVCRKNLQSMCSALAEFDGYCEGELIKVLVGFELGIAWSQGQLSELGQSSKLSLLVTEAYKDAYQKSVKAMKERMNNLTQSLGLPPNSNEAMQ